MSVSDNPDLNVTAHIAAPRELCLDPGKAELQIYEELGLCAINEGTRLLVYGATALGGRVPVKPRGGLLRRGHPVDATGLAQLGELAEQLRRRAGDRQAEGAQIGLAKNAAGFLGPEHAAAATNPSV